MLKTNLFLAFCIASNSLAHLFMKANAVKNGGLSKLSAQDVKTVFLHPFFILAIAFFGLSVVFYSQVLAKLKLNFAFPFMNSITYMVVIIMSFVIFNETLSMRHLFGIFLVVGGIWLMSA